MKKSVLAGLIADRCDLEKKVNVAHQATRMFERLADLRSRDPVKAILRTFGAEQVIRMGVWFFCLLLPIVSASLHLPASMPALYGKTTHPGPSGPPQPTPRGCRRWRRGDIIDDPNHTELDARGDGFLPNRFSGSFLVEDGDGIVHPTKRQCRRLVTALRSND